MIRPPTAEDVPSIMALWNTMIRETQDTFTTIEKSRGDIEDMMAERPHAFFVAEENGRFAGMVTFGVFRTGPGYSTTVEHSILVTPQAQGSGIAADLLKTAEQAARDTGHRIMIAAMNSGNLRARKFHARQGYAQVAHMPQVGRKAGQWLDLVLMQKKLDPDG